MFLPGCVDAERKVLLPKSQTFMVGRNTDGISNALENSLAQGRRSCSVECVLF